MWTNTLRNLKRERKRNAWEDLERAAKEWTNPKRAVLKKIPKLTTSNSSIGLQWKKAKTKPAEFTMMLLLIDGSINCAAMITSPATIVSRVNCILDVGRVLCRILDVVDMRKNFYLWYWDISEQMLAVQPVHAMVSFFMYWTEQCSHNSTIGLLSLQRKRLKPSLNLFDCFQLSLSMSKKT